MSVNFHEMLDKVVRINFKVLILKASIIIQTLHQSQHKGQLVIHVQDLVVSSM